MEIVYWMVGLSFALVSTVFASKLILEAYLEYIQIKEGIEVVRSMRQAEEEQEDEDDLTY